MSNRKGVAALQREFLLSIIRFQGSMTVNAERGIGSKNPHLLRLIADGHVKLIRKSVRTVMSFSTRCMYSRIRTAAVSVQPIHVEDVICPGCGERCSPPRNEHFTTRFISEVHKFDCPVRQYNWAEGSFHAEEARNAKRDRTTNLNKTYHSTRRGKRVDKKRAKQKAARLAALASKYPPTPTVTYE